MNRKFPPVVARLLLIALAVFCLVGQNASHAQVAARLPRAQYYNLFFSYYQADYKRAVKDYNSGANTAFRTGTTRFLDSVCYWTMMGECHYQMGNYAEAVALYEQALDLYLFYASGNWQQRLQQPNITPSRNAIRSARIDWYQTRRTGGIANIPDNFQMLFGRLDAERAFYEGGAVQNAEMKSVDVAEIMRCAALAIHRRRTIKGITCRYDPFTSKLVSGLSGLVRDGSPVGVWNGLIMGLAYASAGDAKRAVPLIQNSLQLAGGLDHHLTPVGLLTLAQLSLSEDLKVAAGLALEASFSAAVRNQFDFVEEALALGTTIHLYQNRSVYPPLENAIAWANRNDANMMQASLTVRLAECLSESGDAAGSEKVLKQTRKPMSGTSLPQSVIAARSQYVSAMNYYLVGDLGRGASTLQRALNRFENGSRWLYQLGLADSLVLNGSVGERQADLLYKELLRDPADTEWKLEPIEAMAYLSSSHVGPMERWFEIAVSRRNFKLALEISELIRRHRFYSSLPMGGRMLAFRWMLHAPEQALTKLAIKQRRDFLTRHPNYKQMSDRSANLRDELLKMPIKPDPDSDELKKQTQLFVELFKLSNAQEVFLASLALRREPAELAFPPQLDLDEIQSRIGPRQVALVSIATPSGYHQVAVSNRSKQYLGLVRSRDMQRAVSSMLKQLGLQDTGGGLAIETLQSEEWKATANQVKQLIFGEVEDQLWDQFDELVVVPDGVLWYLPFEILQLGNAESGYADLMSSVKIRYSPLLSLGFVPQRAQKRITRTVAITGRMHPKGDAAATAAAFDRLVGEIPDAARFHEKIKVPSNLGGSVTDQLVVWSDLKPPSRGGVFALNPVQLDVGSEGSTLGSWLSLPWNGAEHVILPGLTTAGAAGAKGKGNGQDLFQAIVGLLASGSRSVLISRWRVGGESSLELTRDYVQRMKAKRPLDAWVESVAEARPLPVNPEQEPRVKTTRSSDPISANHPFFWAGHLLVEIMDDQSAAAESVVDAAASGNGNLMEKPNAPEKDPDPKNQDKMDEPAEGPKLPPPGKLGGPPPPWNQAA